MTHILLAEGLPGWLQAFNWTGLVTVVTTLTTVVGTVCSTAMGVLALYVAWKNALIQIRTLERDEEERGMRELIERFEEKD